MRATMRLRPAGGVGPGMVVGSAQGRCRAPCGPPSVHLETYANHDRWADARHRRRTYIEQLEHAAVGIPLTERLSPRVLRIAALRSCAQGWAGQDTCIGIRPEMSGSASVRGHRALPRGSKMRVMSSLAGRFLKNSPASSGPGSLPAAPLLACRSLSQGGRPPMGSPHPARTSRVTAGGLAAQSIGLGSSSPIDARSTSSHLDGKDLTYRALVERKRPWTSSRSSGRRG
jgi:hypothetical protein